ncbi:MAG TPA: UdgX family uracil-DNA binding protein [Rhizomicrobium sp.]|nr:UdgX family uracil-DNA binding protein [Rhizomicrobium sp.]
MSTLKDLAEGEQTCRRCPLYRSATQAVPGEGPRRARLMVVGEQPGNDEDLAGHPFVGPAGRVLNEALEEAGIARRKVFVTNAVKHFKFVPRGKRRLHQRPNGEEIGACRVWYEGERELVQPDLIVALGATAARSVLGKVTTIAKVRGRILDLPDGGHAAVTIHPSFLLRLRDAEDRLLQRKLFVQDLKRAREFVQ